MNLYSANERNLLAKVDDVDNAFHFVACLFFFSIRILVSLSCLRECLNSKSYNLFEFLNESKPIAAVLFSSLVLSAQ